MNVLKKAGLGAVALATILTGPIAGASALAQATPSAAVPATPGNYDKTDWPSELNCGLFGGDDTTAALSSAQPLADYLSNWLGMPVEYTTGTSYNAVIESMASNHTNCGTVGPFSYLLGVQEAGAEAIAVETDAPNADNPVYDPAALPSYYSTIVVKKGSGIQHVTDLKGHSFSFVDPASTSGHLMPANGMIQNGLDPDKDIEAIYAGSHPTSGLAVWSDKVDAGAIYEAALVQLQAEGQINLCFWQDGKTNVPRTQADFDALYASCPDGYLVPIWYSDPIPNTPFAVSKSIPESLKQAIYDALMNTKNDPELISALGYWYTDPTDTGNTGAFDPVRVDALYDPLREVAKNLDLDLKSFGS